MRVSGRIASRGTRQSLLQHERGKRCALTLEQQLNAAYGQVEMSSQRFDANIRTIQMTFDPALGQLHAQ